MKSKVNEPLQCEILVKVLNRKVPTKKKDSLSNKIRLFSSEISGISKLLFQPVKLAGIYRV